MEHYRTRLKAFQSAVNALKRLQAETAAELDALLPAIFDRQIDALVYDLYALTPDEIKIVEGAV